MATANKIAKHLVEELGFERTEDFGEIYGEPCDVEVEIEGISYVMDFTMHRLHDVECELFTYYFDRPCDTWRPMKIDEGTKDDIIDAFLDELMAKYRELYVSEEMELERKSREEREWQNEIETRNSLNLNR